MLKKDITYTDFNGNKVTDTYYFNLSTAELTEMQFTTEGGYGEALKRIVDEKDNGKLFLEFKKLILASIGEKSEDGKRFDKNPEIAAKFQQSAAYDQLIVDFFADADIASSFLLGLLPSKMVDAAKPASLAALDPQDPAFRALQAQAAQLDQETRARQGFTPTPPPPAV